MKSDHTFDPFLMERYIERAIDEGAVMEDLTNKWEVARYKWNDKVCVIYKNKHDFLSFNDKFAFLQYSSFIKEQT